MSFIDSTFGLPHDTDVTNRWLIPVCFLVFIVLVVGYRAYLSGDKGPLPVRQPADFDSLAEGRPAPRSTGGTAVRNGVRPAGSALPARRARNAAPAAAFRRAGEALAARLDDAVVALRSDLDSSASIQCVEGLIDAQTGHPSSAIAHFDRCLERQPDSQPALAGKVAALVALRRYEEADGVYIRLTSLAPADAVIRYNRGVLLYRQSRFSEATEQFREAVRIDPDHARAHYNLATLAQRAGRILEARNEWRIFTRLEPNVPSAWFNLGVIWMDFDQPIDAAYCFSQAVRLARDDAEAWLNLAIAQAMAGRLHVALEAAATADRLAPDNPLLMRLLAQVHRELALQGGVAAADHLVTAAQLEARCPSPVLADSPPSSDQSTTAGPDDPETEAGQLP